MSELDLAELRKVAEAATQGIWYVRRDSILSSATEGSLIPRIAGETGSDENAEHIAAFDPATVLALLDRLEDAEAAEDEHDQCPAQCPVCGDWATRTPCDHCKGSGCGPGTALGGYEECEWCAGMGWLHEGCRDTGPSWQERAEAAEAELSREDRQSPELAIKVVGAVARAEAAEAAIERVREVHAPMEALEVRRNQIRQVCTGCGTDDGSWQPYPCPTIRAIDKERR